MKTEPFPRRLPGLRPSARLVLALVGFLVLGSALFLAPGPTLATVPLTGEFRATQDCPLFRSIRKGTQVEGSRLVPGRAYPLLGKNREEATHVLIRVPGLEPGDVWVAVGCGDLSGAGQGASNPALAPAADDLGAVPQRPAQANPRAIPQQPALAYPGSGPQQPAPAELNPDPQRVDLADPQAAPRQPSPAAPGSALAAGDFVLAATWHPAFCEIQAKKPECAPIPDPSTSKPSAGRPDAGPIPKHVDPGVSPGRSIPRYVQGQPVRGQGFALHGLWPQPRERAFCQVPAGERAHAEEGRWSRLPALELSTDTRQRLTVLMPGVVSHLDRYQWSKHGSCQDAAPEDYFRAALDLLEQLNASEVTGLFAGHLGERLRIGEIRAAFDRAFGPSAGQRVGLSCRDDLIVELRLSLRGRPGATPLGDLLRAAPVQAPGCEGGYVDAPGPGRG